MDEQHKLVMELQAKLAELDQRVGNYRRDMVAEFERYTDTLLQNTSSSVSTAVTETISLSKKNYPSLYSPPPPADESGSASSTTNTTTTTNTQEQPSRSSSLPAHEINSTLFPQYSFPKPKSSHFKAPTAATTRTEDDIITEVARSPHEREREFQGVFTPSYLPLLGDNRHDRRASHDYIKNLPPPPRSPSPRSVPDDIIIDTTHADASTDIPRSLATTPDPSKPEPIQRRDTEDSTVSDNSEGVVRRSALRTSSNSSMKPSPRRVRFEFEGVEVLPTSSPIPQQTLLTEGSLLQPSEEEGPGSEQVEDIAYFQEEEEPSPPRPKRITSSQRLLALSRSLKEEDGTTWSTVGGQSDDASSTERGPDSSDSLTGLSQKLLESNTSSNSSNPPSAIKKSSNSPVLSPAATARAEAARSGEDTDSDDDDALNMPSLSSMKGRRSLPEPAILSPATPQDREALTSPSSTPRIPDRLFKNFDELGHDADVAQQEFTMDDLEDELYNIDERGGYNGSSLDEPEDEEEDSPSTKSPASPSGGAPILSQYSRSPAQPIMRVASEPQPATSAGVIGSYRGHPFSMPVVNEDMHEKVAAMGDVTTFVGSIRDGGTASFRGSLAAASFSGAPRSFTERMMMEDMESERRSGR